MTKADLSRCVRTAALIGLAVGALSWAAFGGTWALAYLLSAVWGCVNFWLLARLLLCTTEEGTSDLKRGGWILLKFLFLFGVGGALVTAPFFNIGSFLLGFHTVLAVVLTEALRHASGRVKTASVEESA